MARRDLMTVIQTILLIGSVVLFINAFRFYYVSQQVRQIHDESDLVDLEYINHYQSTNGQISFETNDTIEIVDEVVTDIDTGDPFNQEGEFADPYTNIQQAAYIAHITIPSINVSEQVLMGTRPSILTYAVGLVEGSDIPSSQKGSHSLIAGHRGYMGVSPFFYYADRLRVGDEIYIKTSQEELVYKVTGQQKVLPHEVNKLKHSYSKSLLTLITCTPIYSWSHRILVEAELVID